MREVLLEPPGDWHALARLAAKLHARPLPRNRPLWDMTVIRGLGHAAPLPAGGFGLLVRVHHAAIDGMGGLAALAMLHDLEPEGVPPPSSTSLRDEPLPGAVELLARAMQRPARMLRELCGRPPSVPTLQPAPVSALWPAPPTRFNHGIGCGREVTTTTLQLDRLKRIERCVPGATVNDVLLTIVGGALRSALAQLGELPAASLQSLVPVNARGQAGLRGNNRVAALRVPLATDIDDPLERLRRIAVASRSAKSALAQQSPAALALAAELVAPPLLASGAAFAAGPPPLPAVNTVVTNMAGPPLPLYLGGARLLACHGLGPVTPAAGPFHAAISYCGSVSLTATMAAGSLPAGVDYEQHLVASAEEVVALAGD